MNRLLVTEARTWAWYPRPFINCPLYVPLFKPVTYSLISHHPSLTSSFQATRGSISLTLTREETQSGSPNPVITQGREAAAGYLLSSEWAKHRAKRCADGTSLRCTTTLRAGPHRTEAETEAERDWQHVCGTQSLCFTLLHGTRQKTKGAPGGLPGRGTAGGSHIWHLPGSNKCQ